MVVIVKGQQWIQITKKLNNSLDIIQTWMAELKLKLSEGKCEITYLKQLKQWTTVCQLKRK